VTGIRVAVKTPVSWTVVVLVVVSGGSDGDGRLRVVLPDGISGLTPGTGSGVQMPLLTLPLPLPIATRSSDVQEFSTSRIQQTWSGMAGSLLRRFEESWMPLVPNVERLMS
jgi:hypothetical protein